MLLGIGLGLVILIVIYGYFNRLTFQAKELEELFKEVSTAGFYCSDPRSLWQTYQLTRKLRISKGLCTINIRGESIQTQCGFSIIQVLI